MAADVQKTRGRWESNQERFNRSFAVSANDRPGLGRSSTVRLAIEKRRSAAPKAGSVAAAEHRPAVDRSSGRGSVAVAPATNQRIVHPKGTYRLWIETRSSSP